DELKCNSWISIGDTNSPQDAKKGIEYNKTGLVFFRAQDSAGNYSEWQSAEYDMASDNRCGKNAYPVPVNGKEICVDAYEYPNKAGEVPRDMVSQEQAASLCASEGKRLCSLEEWQAACKGREQNNRYSYGASYIPSRCNSNTKAVIRSGRRTQCRSWWGMYDMNGNLWEWTATKSKEKESAFIAAGGTWSSNNQTRCTESSYSFYPQNQYPSVGFRCCKD
ncbi:MAG: SUMF1/EgtB/PvdO family nonheme iron enzyme, partial [Fibrobacteraceae bacterium]|nr:SUMF1/EgtB/PvdO family nonheme iron enzyme [Fibrobacteraceae bacterium]